MSRDEIAFICHSLLENVYAVQSILQIR